PLLLFHQHYPHHRHLHSFPTRRSSDLIALVRRPESAGEPIGTFPHRGRRRPRCPRRPLRRALTRHGGRPPRHSQGRRRVPPARSDRKSTRLNSSHLGISYAVFCLKKKK